MLFKFPKDDKNFHWTSHVKNKMLFYRISEQKIRTILKSPDRREEGIAPDTAAVMKRNDTPKRKEEIWVMYQSLNHKSDTNEQETSRKSLTTNRSKILLISAWRYPGKSKEGKAIPIPDDVLQDIGEFLK